MDMDKVERLRQKAATLPMEPGVYIMKDKEGKIIYIGKAKLLRNRVSSYFRAVDKHLLKVYRMVQNAEDFEYIVTDSEFEALVLECSMIKQHAPKYNILLKDDKGYHYVKISTGPFGKITAEKQHPADDPSRYIGPFTSSFVVTQTVEETNKVFGLPTCNRRFPDDFGKGRPCLQYHIKQCMGVCRGQISAAVYGEVLDEAIEFIKGGGNASVQLLTRRMEEAAEDLAFERAARYRDRINAIQRITAQQKVIFFRQVSLDVVALVQGAAQDSCAAVLRFREGRMTDKTDFPLGDVATPEEAMGEFLMSYYWTQHDIPKQIYVDVLPEDIALLERFLREKAGCKTSVTRPQKGDGLKLIEMARNNAAQKLAVKTVRTGKEVTALDELGRLLGLEKPPCYIEAYDISNIGSDVVVGGMVAFENGRPLKAAYRKFHIKSLSGTPDDYASMAEMLTRRFGRYEEEKAEGTGFGRLPDLILLDGGKGHVSVIKGLLESLGYTVPVFGMVKDDKHRTRAISADGGEIAISTLRSVFTLVSTIQEEVHRFSITFSRQSHQKSRLELSLEKAPGIGPARAKALFAYFKTRKKIDAATEAELAAVPGMNKRAAAAAYRFLHGEEQANGGFWANGQAEGDK